MCTFQIKGKRFLRIRRWAGISVSVSILVIAFVVKGYTFENESDILRQALRSRHQDTLSAVDNGKPLPENIKKYEIQASLEIRKKKGALLYELLEDLLMRSLGWINDNNNKNVVVGIFISGMSGIDQENPQEILQGFIPLGAVIFYKEKENQSLN